MVSSCLRLLRCSVSGCWGTSAMQTLCAERESEASSEAAETETRLLRESEALCEALVPLELKL